MTGDGAIMTARRARKLLGVRARASASDIRTAYREAAKAAHPDRGGDAGRFREVIEAYRVLREAEDKAPALIFPPVPAAPVEAPLTVQVTPLVAACGGTAEAALSDGRTVRLDLAPGLRHGDKVRAGGDVLTVLIRADGGAMVRGDDLWMTARVAPQVLAEGGRVALDTPLGRRIVWISRKAGARGLVRLPGQGLPARGAHALGSLFLRLEAEAAAESPARSQLRRFAAAWAA